VLVDELHCQRGEKYREILDAYHKAGAHIVGFTATPSNLFGVVDDVYRVGSVPELIKQGFLCQPRVFSCGAFTARQLDQLRRDGNGEYLPADIEKLVKPKIIFGKVIQNLRRLNPDGRPFVLFAHSVKSSIGWAQSMTHTGIATAHIDGDVVWVDGKFYKSDSAKRNEVFDRVKSGDLRGLSNRFVLREGVDLPCIGHAILTCPVGSRTSFVQMCGRVLRPFENREYAIIQDHAGSVIEHPALDSGEDWDWQADPGLLARIRRGELKEDRIPEPIVCPECMGVRQIGDTCPYCGFRYPKRARYVIQLTGDLQLMEGKTFRAPRVTPRPDDATVWENLYFGAVKNGARTAEQVRAYFAYTNNWRWLPRNLPLMPRNQSDWFRPLKDVPRKALY
jgi:superfamily II DNA or RNA helicase